MAMFGHGVKLTLKKPRLVIITGCAGSGKTTIGKKLAQKLGYAYIDKDTVTRDFTDYILNKLGSSPEDRESDLYRNDVLPIEYAVTLKVCREILEGGVSVVLTIPFISQISEYEKWKKLMSNAKIKESLVKISFVWIRHNIDNEHENIINRNAVRDHFKLNNWESYSQSVEGIEPDERYKAYIYENDLNADMDATLNELIKWIK